MTDAAILAELRAEVEGLRESHEYLLRRLLDREDRRMGAALVPLMADMMGDRPVTVAEVAALALNDPRPEGQALRELIAESGDGMRGFGRLLARLEGVNFDGCRLVSAGQRGHVAVWRIKRRGD